MQPKKFSEYSPIPADQIDGSEIFPVVKDDHNGVIQIEDLPISNATQEALDDKASADQGEKADSAVQPSELAEAIENFETSTQLDERDTANRNFAIAMAVALG